MKNLMSLSSNLLFTFGCAPSYILLSRPDTFPERRRAPQRASFCLAASLFLIVGLSVPPSGFAKPGGRLETLAAQYLLDKRVEDSDGAQIRRKLLRLQSRPAVRLFLAVIQLAEGGEPNIMVGGCRANDLRQHPAVTLPRRCWYRIWLSGKWMFSTASGNYQITFSNWKRLAPFLGLSDFSETSQALAALELIRRGGGAANAYTPEGMALKRRIQRGFLALLRGDVNSALCLATYDWASSNCSPLPAGRKIDYVRLADAVRKKQRGRTEMGRGSKPESRTRARRVWGITSRLQERAS